MLLLGDDSDVMHYFVLRAEHAPRKAYGMPQEQGKVLDYSMVLRTIIME